MAEFEVGDRKFRTRKLSAMEQLHCSRRLAPLIEGFQEVIPGVSLMSLENISTIVASATPFAKAFASLSDNDIDFIVGKCLARCELQQGSGWAPIWNVQAKRPMFDDLEMAQIVQLCWAVLQESLESFFDEIASKFVKPPPEESLTTQ